MESPFVPVALTVRHTVSPSHFIPPSALTASPWMDGPPSTSAARAGRTGPNPPARPSRCVICLHPPAGCRRAPLLLVEVLAGAHQEADECFVGHSALELAHPVPQAAVV